MKLMMVPLLLFLFSPAYGQFALPPKIRVQPRCDPQLITVAVTLNKDLIPGGNFTDWIVVGVTGKDDCRLKGNGELQYVIEIAIRNDPCGTMMPSPGVFENRVRIGQNPFVILANDETFTVRCVYGLPEVGTLPLPMVQPNFAIDNAALGIGAFGQQPGGGLSTVGMPINPTAGTGELTAEQLAAINRQLLENARNGGSASILANGGLPSSFGGLTNNTGPYGSNNAVVVKGTQGVERPNPFIGQFSQDGFRSVTGSEDPQGGIKNALDIRPIGNGIPDSATSNNANFAEAGFQPGMQNATSTGSRLSQILLFALLAFLLLALILLCCLYFCMKRRHRGEQQTNNMRVSMPPVSGVGKVGLGSMWWTGRTTNAQGEYAGLDSTRRGSAVSPADSAISSTHPASSQQPVLPRKHFEKNKRSFGGYDGAITAFDRRGSSDSQSHADYLPTNGMNLNPNAGYASTRRSNLAFVADEEHHYASGDFLSTRSPLPDGSPPPAPMLKDYANLGEGSSYVEHYITETEHLNNEYNEKAVDVAEVSKNISRDRFEHIDQSIAELQKIQPKSYSEWRKTLLEGRDHGQERPASTAGVQVSSREVPAGLFPEEGISSFRSITEIYQSVETRKDDFARDGDASANLTQQLADAVLPMRGFGPRKLNEQELGRWRQLIKKDSRLRDLLKSCQNIGDVLSVSERSEYRNLFSREKWGEIARCLAESPLIKSNLASHRSNSNLNVYVGSIGTDW